MEDLRTGYYERNTYWGDDADSDWCGKPFVYGQSSVGSYAGTVQKEDEALEEKFALYKLQNIIAVVAVLLLIIMDIFHIRVGGIDSDIIFTELSHSFTVQEFFQQLVQLPQHLFSSPAP